VGDADPHIHVDVDLHADVEMRHTLSATFGLVGDLPSHASTGCGLEVPYAMTSTRPDNVTCLACREYAERRYLELAAYVEQLSHTPGTNVDIRQRAARATDQYLDIARRFADPQD
jgi:hypothetical protein